MPPGFSACAQLCVCPEGANPLKVAAIRALRRRHRHLGRDFDDARDHREQLALDEGCRYVHSGNEPRPDRRCGHLTLEILDQEPGIDVVIVPIGGGSGAAGACVVAKAIDPTFE